MSGNKMRLKNRPTLLYHHRTQAVDAQGIHINEMCRAFDRAGWQVEMVSLVHDEAVGKESREGGLFRLLSLLPGWAYECLEIAYTAFGVLRLFRAVRRHRPVFIYERYSIYNLAGAIVSLLTGVPLVEEVNSPLAMEKKACGSLYLPALARKLETWIMNRAFRVVAVTGVLKEILIDNGADGDRITVMPNGVNPAEYPSPSCAESDAGGSDRPVTLGFVGWFRKWHGLRELIQGMGEIRRSETARPFRLLLVGDGPARPEIEAEIRDQGLSGRVEITGALDRAGVRQMLDRMDVALQPAATSYASPMKLIEYMAAGKAIIAPDQPNIRELLAHGRTGLLFPPGDWAEFVRRIVDLAGNPDEVRRLGAAAAAEVARRPLTWDENARRTLAFFAAAG